MTKVAYSGLPRDANQEDIDIEGQIGECFRVIISKTAETYFNLLKSIVHYKTNKEELFDECVKLIFKSCLSRVLPFVKHGAFHAERECRLLRILSSPKEETSLKFRQKSQMMTRHLPIGLEGQISWPITPACDKDDHRFLPLPIREIIVGPARHQAVSKQSVEAMLRKHGYMKYDRSKTGYDWDEVEVRCSLIPLQNT